jgi:D-beta-D-heptose 7-phosphate kinase/D-beta-D-heptose 1-phosphate adenosyltransferase
MKNTGPIVVVGDVMLDQFLYGKVKRLNPESPSPLINIDREEHKLGGAANVAANVASLGGNAVLIGKIGKDSNGRIFSGLCESMGIRFDGIASDSEPTITKARIIEGTYGQQLLRMDYETIAHITDEVADRIFSLVQGHSPSLVIVSDYKKGVVIEKLARSLVASGIRVVADAKPGKIPHFENALLIKPNFKEFLGELGISEPNTDETIERYGPDLAKRLKTNLLVTRSEKGASLIHSDGSVVHMPTEALSVFDVTGAGDTFIAAVAVAITEGKSLEEAVRFGNRASGVAVGKVGTVAVRRDEVGNL